MLAERSLEAALVTDVRDIYYFTGTIVPSDLPAALVVGADGADLLVAPRGFEGQGVDRTISFSWNVEGTRDPDIPASLARSLVQNFPLRTGRRLGIQTQSLGARLQARLADAAAIEFAPLDDALAALQARKDADEIAVIRAAVRANLGAYAAVRAAIRPGASELDVLAAGYRGAMQAAGEKVWHDGDYRCGEFNGPARARSLEEGELYIVDAWTCYRGYWSDLSRTYYVGRQPTDVQRRLYEHVRYVLESAERELRPGVDGADVCRMIDSLLREHPPLADCGLTHHGGHAIGLRSHEMPDVNLTRGGRLEAGNVLCLEPGGYFPAARAGVRLERMFLINEAGCENLSDDALELDACS